jgi:Ca-activated chloride channel family protein
MVNLMPFRRPVGATRSFRKYTGLQTWGKAIAVSLLLSGFLSGCSDGGRWTNLWQTQEQQAQELMRAGDYPAAVGLAVDPLRRGNALYRGKDFKNASEVYAGIASAEGRFNLGNTLVLLGRYEEAIKAYREALTIRPDWLPAKDNLLIARLRAERLQTEGGGMTGGQLEADEIVFEEGGSDKASKTIEMTGGEPLTDEQLRLLWLRNVQTRPADFLRVKFAYQYAMQGRGVEQ